MLESENAELRSQVKTLARWMYVVIGLAVLAVGIQTYRLDSAQKDATSCMRVVLQPR